MTDPDPPEVADLEAAAAWRLRMLDADPADPHSAAAAERLQRLADAIRRHPASPLRQEYDAICNWLAESDDIADFALLAHEYRLRVGIDEFPETAEDYLRALLAIARRTFGAA